jgi:hypothetical protein
MSTVLSVKCTLTEEALGMTPANPEVTRDYIASKAPYAKNTEEEVAAIGAEAFLDKQKTVFPRDAAGNPIWWDYQMRGAFKDWCGGLSRADGTLSRGMPAYKKVIDTLIFVRPRQIIIHLPAGGKLGECQRPLRAMTMQGERVSLALSETIPVGSWFEFEIHLIAETADGKKEMQADGAKGKSKIKLLPVITEWLDYGQYRGFGQWRNSGKGLFTYTLK